MRKEILCLGIVLVIPLVIFGCVYDLVPYKTNYLKKKSTIGILVVTKEIEYLQSSGGSYFSDFLAMSKPKIFNSVLNTINEKVNPTELIRKNYAEIYYALGKEVKLIDDTFRYDLKGLENYSLAEQNEKYLSKDVRFFKEKYKIDELLLIRVRYGVHSHYFYGGELYRNGYTTIFSRMIDLTNNQFIYKYESSTKVPIIKNDIETIEGKDSLTAGIVKSTLLTLPIEKKYLLNIQNRLNK